MYCIASTHSLYRHLDLGLLHQWTRYCPGIPIEIFETETADWSGSLVRKIETIADKSILWVLNDYWVTNPADLSRIQVARDLVESGRADKVDLAGQTNYWDHTDRGEMVEATQTAQYRQSTQAACWSRRYLLRCLAHGGNPWQWELAPWSINDNATILGFRTPVIRYADVMMKGQPHGFMLCHLSDRDLAELDGIGALAGLMDPATIRAHGPA